jgi:hypothetical protein
MAVLKCVWIFRASDGYGWQEIHFWNSASQTPDLVARITNMATQITPYRAPLMGADCVIEGYRVSYPVTNGIASKAAAENVSGEPGQLTASQNDSLAIVMQDGTNTRKKVIHQRGLWDSVISNETFVPLAVPGSPYNVYLASYLAQLVSQGYGWLGKDQVNSVYGWVNSYVENPDGTVTFTVSPLGANPLPPVGYLVNTRFSKLNKGRSVLNRTMLCEVLTSTTVKTIYPIAAGPFQAIGRFYMNVYTFIQYNNPGRISLGERRMGRPIGRYPGRRSRRPVT